MRKGIAPPAGIFGPDNALDISADRMDYDAIEDMTAVGDATCRYLLEQQLKKMQGKAGEQDSDVMNQLFRGWAAMPDGVLEELGWVIKDSPLTDPVDNPYHADICLPDRFRDMTESDDTIWMAAILELCAKLAGKCCWQERHGPAPEE